MRVLLFGNGCREHALAWKLRSSPLCEELYFLPSSSVLSLEGKGLDLEDPSDYLRVAELVKENKIDLLVCGPEKPLSEGLTDKITEIFPSCKVVGPSKAASQLESSKKFAKAMMEKAGVPTARFSFETDFEALHEKAHKELSKNSGVVLKVDGLAGGKGVFVCHSKEDLEEALSRLKAFFKEKAPKVLIEEELKGREFSYFSLVNHKYHTPLGCAVDFKRLKENDEGPNTGGMGAYTPVPWLPEGWEEDIKSKIMDPLLQTLAKENISYNGILYCGLMLTAEGPKIIEFNVRFGDPEAQVLLANEKRDLLALFLESFESKEGYSPFVPTSSKSVGVVLASSDYPYCKEDKSDSVSLIPKEYFNNQKSPYCFGASMEKRNNAFVSKKGRVITVVGQSENSFVEAKSDVEKRMKTLKDCWSDSYYRNDIASKVIREEASALK